MRRFIIAAAAVAALAGAASLGSNRAEAMQAASGLTAAPAAEQVYLRCTRVWNGWRWVRSCVDVGGYGPGPGYYGPGYGYGGWRPRPRYYGYY